MSLPGATRAGLHDRRPQDTLRNAEGQVKAAFCSLSTKLGLSQPAHGAAVISPAANTKAPPIAQGQALVCENMPCRMTAT